MKKMSWITGILAGLMVILAALGSVCNVIYRISVDETFYGAQSRAAVKAAMGFETEEEVTAYIGLERGEQEKIAEEICIYMTGEDQSFDLPYIFSHDEVRHMLDVRHLTWTARDMSKTYLTLAAAVAVVIAWTGAKLKKRIMPKAVGALGAIALIELVVMNVVNEIRNGGFAAVFAQMHETLFTNDLWLMDPAEDILIRMMPQQLFEQALLNGASMALRMMLVVCLLLLAIDVIVGGMIRRHVSRG